MPGLRPEDAERRLAVAGRDDGLVRVGGDLAGGRTVHLAVDRHDPAEGGDRVGLERLPVGLDELVVGGQPDRVGVLGDGHGRSGEVGRHAVGGVEVEQVVEARQRTLDLLGVGERPGPVGGLAVEGRPLVGVLAVAQVLDLLEDHRQPTRERRPGDLVDVGGDLGVIGGHDPERVGGQLLAELGRDGAELLELADKASVVGRVRDGRDTRRSSGRPRRGGRLRRRRSSRSLRGAAPTAHRPGARTA